jgi:MFS family permease
MSTEQPGPTGIDIQRPSRVRYGVLAFLCSLSFILYLDRVCIGQAVEPIQNELDLSNTAMGIVLAAFTLAYGLFEIPTGHWGDRYGSRGVLTRIVIWWSIFTALTGAATGFVTLVLVRFLFGAGEAGALPNSARVVARWFPPGARGPAQGSVSTANQVGGAVAPVLTAYLIHVVGWRWAFVLFGMLGIGWAAAFYLWFRDDPAEHPAVNEGEQQLLASGRGAEARKQCPELASNAGQADAASVGVSQINHRHLDPHPPVPWGQVLTSPNIWLMGTVMSCAAFVSYMYMSWYPKYLQAARGVSPIWAGWLASMVLAGGAIGCILGGFLSDWMVRRTGERCWSRRAIGIGSCTFAALAIVGSIYCDSPVAAALLTAFACLSAQVQIASWWAVVTEISGRHVGALFGLMNSLGVPGAVTSQLFLGLLADYLGEQGFTGRDQWDPAFYVYGAVLLCGAFCWLFINAHRSAVEKN